MPYKKYKSIILLMVISLSSDIFLISQSEIIAFTHTGDGDIRMMLDPNNPKWIKEYRLGIGYNQHLKGFNRFSTSVGVGYVFYHFLRPHYFVNGQASNSPIVDFTSANTKYHNALLSINLKYQINKFLDVSLILPNEFTVFAIPDLPGRPVIKDRFKFHGSGVYLGLGIKKGRSVWTPQMRIFMFRPTDSRLFNQMFENLSPEYATQIDDQFNFNGTSQIGLQYAYQFIREKRQKHKKGKLICD